MPFSSIDRFLLPWISQLRDVSSLLPLSSSRSCSPYIAVKFRCQFLLSRFDPYVLFIESTSYGPEVRYLRPLLGEHFQWPCGPIHASLWRALPVSQRLDHCVLSLEKTFRSPEVRSNFPQIIRLEYLSSYFVVSIEPPLNLRSLHLIMHISPAHQSTLISASPLFGFSFKLMFFSTSYFLNMVYSFILLVSKHIIQSTVSLRGC